LNVKCRIRSLGTKTTLNSFTKWSDSEMELNKKFHHAKHSIHEALCGKLSICFNNYNSCNIDSYRCIIKNKLFVTDNVDTRTVLDVIRELVTICNVYVCQNKNPNTLLLRDIAVYITKIFTIFGAISSSHDAIGFPIDDEIVGTNVRQNILMYFFHIKISS